jgi:dipeptidyl aminopeptidase/acylaminoacyl peptidase
MQRVQQFQYKTRDGYKVESYLTLPATASKEHPPALVVLVHGGPWVRDTMEWDPEVQFLASRGYAVFQPNYRGSSGYNWSFPPGDQWEFKKMHNDVTDGVKKLIASGLIDARRIAIMGASFGGYLSLCGATYEPGLYRCAITEAGVFDWKEMMRDARSNQYDSYRYEWFLRNLGDPKKQSDLFEDISPIRHVDQIKIPVLVAHGKEDGVVSIEQSTRLVAALKQAHVPCTVFFRSGEGHGMARLKNRTDYYTEVEKFLQDNLTAH